MNDPITQSYIVDYYIEDHDRPNYGAIMANYPSKLWTDGTTTHYSSGVSLSEGYSMTNGIPNDKVFEKILSIKHGVEVGDIVVIDFVQR